MIPVKITHVLLILRARRTCILKFSPSIRHFFYGTLIANLCKFLVQISFYSRPPRQTTMTVAAKVAVQVLEINENKPIENVADIFARRLRTLKKRLVIILFTSLSVLIIFYPPLDENRKK